MDEVLVGLQSVAFTDYKSLPAISAVYFVLTEENKVVYIGASTNLNRRWLRHSHVLSCVERGAATIGYLPCEHSRLQTVESAMIQRFLPVLNRLTYQAPYTLQVSIPDALRQRLKVVVAAEDTTMYAYVVHALERAVLQSERWQQQKQAGPAPAQKG